MTTGFMLIGAPSGAVLAGNLTALPPEALSAGEGFFDFTASVPASMRRGASWGSRSGKARGKIRRSSAPTPKRRSLSLSPATSPTAKH
ncbi:MAG: hypothetical protein R3C40_11545 [Parvularculaceae bacterium]